MFNNLTSLERLSMRQMKIPCYGPIKAEEGFPVIPNEYDMLWIANLKQHLGTSMWKWFIPISDEMKG